MQASLFSTWRVTGRGPSKQVNHWDNLGYYKGSRGSQPSFTFIIFTVTQIIPMITLVVKSPHPPDSSVAVSDFWPKVS